MRMNDSQEENAGDAAGPLRARAEGAVTDLRDAFRALGLRIGVQLDPATAEVSAYPLICLDGINAETATDLADALRHTARCGHG